MPKFKKNPSAMGSPYKMKKAPYKHTSASHPTGAIAAHEGHGGKLTRLKPKKLKKKD